jgi:hypothetical protein
MIVGATGNMDNKVTGTQVEAARRMKIPLNCKFLTP